MRLTTDHDDVDTTDIDGQTREKTNGDATRRKGSKMKQQRTLAIPCIAARHIGGTSQGIVSISYKT